MAVRFQCQLSGRMVVDGFLRRGALLEVQAGCQLCQRLGCIKAGAARGIRWRLVVRCRQHRRPHFHNRLQRIHRRHLPVRWDLHFQVYLSFACSSGDGAVQVHLQRRLALWRACDQCCGCAPVWLLLHRRGLKRERRRRCCCCRDGRRRWRLVVAKFVQALLSRRVCYLRFLCGGGCRGLHLSFIHLARRLRFLLCFLRALVGGATKLLNCEVIWHPGVVTRPFPSAQSGTQIVTFKVRAADLFLRCEPVAQQPLPLLVWGPVQVLGVAD